MAHRTVGLSLPEDIMVKLPALMVKYNVNTNSMLIRKILQEAINYHLPDEQAISKPKGDDLKVAVGSPKGDTEPPKGVLVITAPKGDLKVWPVRLGCHVEEDKLPPTPEVCLTHTMNKIWDSDNEVWVCVKCME